jgi:hypothetical protein
MRMWIPHMYLERKLKAHDTLYAQVYIHRTMFIHSHVQISMRAHAVPSTQHLSRHQFRVLSQNGSHNHQTPSENRVTLDRHGHARAIVSQHGHDVSSNPTHGPTADTESRPREHHVHGNHYKVIDSHTNSHVPAVNKTPDHGGYGFTKGGTYHSKYQGAESTPDHRGYGYDGNGNKGHGGGYVEGTPEITRAPGGLEENLKVNFLVCVLC